MIRCCGACPSRPQLALGRAVASSSRLAAATCLDIQSSQTEEGSVVLPAGCDEAASAGAASEALIVMSPSSSSTWPRDPNHHRRHDKCTGLVATRTTKWQT